eukprot:gene28834-37840_t
MKSPSLRSLLICCVILALLSSSSYLCEESEATVELDSDAVTSTSPSSQVEDDTTSSSSTSITASAISSSPATEQSDETTATKAKTRTIKKGPTKTVFTELFGSSLYSWNTNSANSSAASGQRQLIIEELSTSEVLREGSKDAVAVYFSASWCAPCRQFTPLLAQFYSTVNKKLGSKNVSDYNDRRFEVVWVSKDSSVDEFVQYYTKMPWLAVPYDKVEECIAKLAPKYKLRGIPHLVILDGSDASVYTLDGRGEIMKDKYGMAFPYAPKTPVNVLLSLLPRQARTELKKRIREAKKDLLRKLSGVFRGLLEGIGAPKALVQMIFREQEEVAAEAFEL